MQPASHADAAAERTAELMNRADLQGSDGHGIIRLAPYIARIEAGGINLRPNIGVIIGSDAAMALIDGDNAMGHLVMDARRATRDREGEDRRRRVGRHALQQPRRTRVAVRAHAARARHDRHVLRGRQRQPPAAVGRARHAAVDQPDRGRGAVGRATTAPIVLDMATTVAAYGKVKAHGAEGEPMPEGWMIDRQGNALLDPKRAAEGFLLPIGGYKGYGLATDRRPAGRHAQRRGDGP